MAVEVDVSSSDVDESVAAEDGESSALEQESIRLKDNAKIVAKRGFFSFFIEPKYVSET